MNNYKLTIEYDGSSYRGWQKLTKTDKTIQGKLESVIKTLTGEDTEVIGATQTELGVHAMNQIANFKTNKTLKESEILRHFKEYLPEDIHVKDCAKVDELFHAKYNAKSKTFIYRICTIKGGNVFDRKYSYHTDKKLDLNKMKEAAKSFIGKHDFTSFANAKSKTKSNIREVYSIDFNETDGYIEISLIANDFLFNMAKTLIGALIEAGVSNLDNDEIEFILAKKERNLAPFTAMNKGFLLKEISF